MTSSIVKLFMNMDKDSAGSVFVLKKTSSPQVLNVFGKSSSTVITSPSLHPIIKSETQNRRINFLISINLKQK